MAPVRGKDIHDNYYKKIYQVIEELGFQLTDKYLIDHSIEKHYKQFEGKPDKYYEEFYNQTIEKIKSANINIFECSVPSLGLGFQIEKSLEYNKPTIILYLQDHIPHFIAGIKNDKLIIQCVKLKSLKADLEKILNEARTIEDKRFNFFISPKLLNYLNIVAKKEGLTKSSVIRNLILEHMKKNADI